MEIFAMSKHTVAEIEALPDGERAELIDGEMYMMATPSMIHQRISMFLSNTLYSYIKNKGGNCEVFAAPFAVYPDESGYNYLEPDVLVICHPDNLDNKGVHGGPDLVIEIVSPSSKYMDYMRKLKVYERIGVREYWIVDPNLQRVTVYNFENGIVGHYSFTDDIPVGIYEDLNISLKDVKLD